MIRGNGRIALRHARTPASNNSGGGSGSGSGSSSAPPLPDSDIMSMTHAEAVEVRTRTARDAARMAARHLEHSTTLSSATQTASQLREHANASVERACRTTAAVKEWDMSASMTERREIADVSSRPLALVASIYAADAASGKAAPRRHDPRALERDARIAIESSARGTPMLVITTARDRARGEPLHVTVYGHGEDAFGITADARIELAHTRGNADTRPSLKPDPHAAPTPEEVYKSMLEARAQGAAAAQDLWHSRAAAGAFSNYTTPIVRPAP